MRQATNRKMPVITRYGPRTMLASKLRYASNCAGLMAETSLWVCSMPERMNAAPRTGVTTAPTALNDWARFNRRSELCAGPRIVT